MGWEMKAGRWVRRRAGGRHDGLRRREEMRYRVVAI